MQLKFFEISLITLNNFYDIWNCIKRFNMQLQSTTRNKKLTLFHIYLFTFFDNLVPQQNCRLTQNYRLHFLFCTLRQKILMKSLASFLKLFFFVEANEKTRFYSDQYQGGCLLISISSPEAPNTFTFLLAACCRFF